MEGSEKREQYVYISHCAGIAFFGEVRRGMNDAAALLDVDVSFGGTEDFDPEGQLCMLDKAISGGAAGIATTIIDPEAYAEPIARALKAGIPVIAFNTDASAGRAGHLATVAQDTFAAGRKLGSYIAERKLRDGKVLVTCHSDHAPPLLARSRGIREVLESCGADVETVVTGNGADVSLMALRKYMAGRMDIGTLVGTGQDDTEAIGSWLAESGEKIDGYGFDYTTSIQSFLNKGILQGVIDQQPYAQGFYPLLFMWLHRHRGIQPADINPGMKLHTYHG
jgi:simple sugar transport system substrate-binding protein